MSKTWYTPGDNIPRRKNFYDIQDRHELGSSAKQEVKGKLSKWMILEPEFRWCYVLEIKTVSSAFISFN